MATVTRTSHIVLPLFSRRGVATPVAILSCRLTGGDVELTWPRTDQPLPKVSHQDVVRLCKSRFLLLQDSRASEKGCKTVKFNTLVRGDALTKDDE